RLDNTTNNPNRLPNTASITLNGGSLSYQGVASAASTETVGVITLARGHSTISTTPGTGGSVAITASSLVRTSTATANFNGTSLGTSSNKITLTAAPAEVGAGAVTASEGILPYATVNANDFANYDGTLGT